MDGYSVTEAASVLGVPTERVWELLARGVLSGTPEGDTGMRVFLQPRPKPATGDDPRRPNGDRVGAEPERELSPFRELLTEFRGLTERYGQALLALGEARGEVAALRSRVDVLEARMDLRLPMGTQPSASWPAPMPESPRVAAPLEHLAPGPEHPAPEPEHTDEEEHRARSRGPRRATDSFAEALARAEDPSPPELRPAAAPGEQHTAPHAADADDAAEHGLPRELPPAEMVPVADEPESAVEAQPEPEPEPEPVVEPMAAMDAEAEEPVALEVEPEPVVVEAAAPEPEPLEPVGEETAEAEPVEAEPEPGEGPPTTEAEPVEAEPEPAEGATAEAEPAQAEPEPAPEAAPEPMTVEAELEPVPEPEIDFDANRYTTAIEEPDWFEAEADEPAAQPAEPEPAPAFELEPDLHVEEPEPEPEVAPEPAPVPEPDAELHTEPEPEAEVHTEPEPEAEPVEPAPLEESEPEPAPEPVEAAAPEHLTPPREATAADEETMLWFGQRPAADTGADEMEVAGGTSPSQAGAEGPEPDLLPGSRELDEALSSLEELTRRTRQTGPDETDEWPPASGEPSSGASSWAMPPRAPMPGGLRPGSPATRAYRRLRRIFPG